MNVWKKGLALVLTTGILVGIPLNTEASMMLEDISSNLDASTINLPTRGVSIDTKEQVTETSGDNYYRIRGHIHSVDSNAPEIEFQVNLPTNWNGKMAQFGGGGFDGQLVTADDASTGLGKESKTPLEQGYVTCGSDGGHKSTMWEAEWALNDEALQNFAYEQLKKVRDAAVAITKDFYGKNPERIYFIGGSNGGREALMAAQRFPNDYDGIVSFYPVLNWVPKAIKDSENADVMQRNQGEGWISPELYEKVSQRIYAYGDGLDGIKDGIISNPQILDQQKDTVITSLSDLLTTVQMDTLRAFYRDKTYLVPMANGYQVMPGYSLAQKLSDGPFNQFGSIVATRDGHMEVFGDQVIKYQIIRDAEFNPKDFQPQKWEKQVYTASKLLDATNPDLDSFKAHGGKIIMLHGTADQLVALNGSIRYFQLVQQRYGKIDTFSFMRFYLVPGYGHGEGTIFTMGRDILSDLDQWVEKGNAPATLDVIGQNSENKGKVLTLQPMQ